MYIFSKMPRASRVKQKKEQQEKLMDNLIHVLSGINNKSHVQNFLNDLLTEEEKVMLSKRLMLYALLKKGYPPTTIKTLLNISYETIRIHGGYLQNKNNDFNLAIENIIKRTEMAEFWKKVEKILKPIDLALRSKTDMKARAKFASGDWQ